MLTTGRDEGGYSLVELLVTMTVFLLVSGTLLGALESGLRTERRASGRIDDEQALRLVLAQFSRDVRGADAVTPTALSTLPAELDLASGAQSISWRYDPVAGRLSRTVSSGSTTSPGVSVLGVANGATPVFRLLDRSGADLSVAPGNSAADAFRCAVGVEASVTSNAHPGVAPFTETAIAELHVPPDLEGCP